MTGRAFATFEGFGFPGQPGGRSNGLATTDSGIRCCGVRSGSVVLKISNLYGHGFDGAQRAMLAGMGFSLRPKASVYAGSQLCHFIDFPRGPALELIEVTDRSDYESFVPAGMAPFCPGISIVVGDGSPEALDAYEREFASHEPYRLRVPYPGGTNAAAPGWHYLNLTRPVVPGTFIWLTAFDPPKPAPARATRHANTVLGVSGLLFDLRPGDLDDLSRLVGQPTVEGALRIGDVTIVATGAEGPPRRFPLRAVVLQSDSLDTVRGHAPTAQETSVMGRPAVRIETNPLAWDLLITD